MKSLVVLFLLALISLSLYANAETDDRAGGDGSVEDRSRVWVIREETETRTEGSIWIVVGVLIAVALICIACGVAFWACNRAKQRNPGTIYNGQPGAAPPTTGPPVTAVPMHIPEPQPQGRAQPMNQSAPAARPAPSPPMFMPNGTGPWTSASSSKLSLTEMSSPNTAAAPMPPLPAAADAGSADSSEEDGPPPPTAPGPVAAV